MAMSLAMTADCYSNSARDYLIKGQAKQAKGDLNGAIAEYGKGIQLAPNARLYIQRGLALAARGNIEAAIDDYTRAIAIRPDYWPAYSYRGNAERAKGDQNGAAADYAVASRIAMNSGRAKDVWEQNAMEQSMTSLPMDAKAVIYVYHQMPHRRPFDGYLNVNTYANRNFLGMMPVASGSYARLEVPKGKIVVTATGAGFDEFTDFLPGGNSTPLCTNLDWQRLGEAQPSDLARCRSELADAQETVNRILAEGNPIRNPEELIRLCHPQTQDGGQQNGKYIALIDTEVVKFCAGQLGYGLHILTGENVIARAEIDAEIGKTYYVEWSLSDSRGFGHGIMTQIDEVTGAKAIAGLPNWTDRGAVPR